MDQSIPHDKPSASNVPDSPMWRKTLDNPWLMLVLLFFVTAALGIPFLWMSRAFSTLAKLVLTVVVLLWTALILWLFWLVMVWSWTRVSDALGW
jgi:hypothetical protein